MKKKETELQQIIQKCKDLCFYEEEENACFEYSLPFGINSKFTILLDIDIFKAVLWKHNTFITIRKIESPEDLENLFNAICPEKYRLPFS